MKICPKIFQVFLTLGSILQKLEGRCEEKSSHFSDRRERRWVFGGPPQFHPDTPVNVTAQLGGTAYLPCRIKNLGNKSVSWIRSRDSHILTVDRYTFIADERFVAWHDRATRSWTLMVRYVQDRDAGRYECQVSTEPKMSHFIELSVIKPRVEISNEQDVYVKSGSRVLINCTILNSIEEPQYIFWYHDSRRIVGVNSSREMDVRHIPPQTTVGSYAIKKASLTDSGNYTCEPAGLENATVTLHVLAGEQPAAMQHGNKNNSTKNSSSIPWIAFLFLISFIHSFMLNKTREGTFYLSIQSTITIVCFLISVLGLLLPNCAKNVWPIILSVISNKNNSFFNLRKSFVVIMDTVHCYLFSVKEKNYKS